jgi:hypothetical protein
MEGQRYECYGRDQTQRNATPERGSVSAIGTLGRTPCARCKRTEDNPRDRCTTSIRWRTRTNVGGQPHVWARAATGNTAKEGGRWRKR